MAGAAVVLVVIGVVVFRPDKLVVDQRVDEQLDSEVAAVVDESTPTTLDSAADAPAASPSTPSQAQEVARGTFVGQAGHRVNGTAVVVEREGGLLLVLPELDAENGPDLQPYLSPESGGSVKGGRYLEPLKGNQGTQTYKLPAGVDLTRLGNVVIWCERFSTPFGTAALTG